MDYQLDPDVEQREKRALKAFLDDQVAARASNQAAQDSSALEKHQFVLECLKTEMSNERHKAHHDKLSLRSSTVTEWDRHKELGRSQAALGYHKVI